MRTLITMLVFLAVIGCKKENASEPTSSGAFQYNAYDTTGRLLVNGWFTLNMKDSAQISGEWHFKKVYDPRNITGPQSGDGQLSGLLKDGILSINLNPRFMDNNVFLDGSLSRNDYTGTWRWISFPGVTGSGNFKAHKQ